MTSQGDSENSRAFYITIIVFLVIIFCTLVANCVYMAKLQNDSKDSKNQKLQTSYAAALWMNAIMAVVAGAGLIWTIIKLVNYDTVIHGIGAAKSWINEPVKSGQSYSDHYNMYKQGVSYLQNQNSIPQQQAMVPQSGMQGIMGVSQQQPIPMMQNFAGNPVSMNTPQIGMSMSSQPMMTGQQAGNIGNSHSGVAGSHVAHL